MPPKSTETPIAEQPAGDPTPKATWYADPTSGERIEAERPPMGGSWSTDPDTGELVLVEPPHPPAGLTWKKVGSRFRLVPAKEA